MTSNHLLLYRLAELMLEHEQQMLPVDLLFDDEQIGDFVKSIQIDSPYQQMLLEGVLTESVHEEKLFVSFTVEGYFHYVLGEVIYNQTNGKGPESLKQIVEECKLNGAKEGVEQCLIRDVQKDDLTRLMWLIDEGGKLLEVCINPIAYALTKVNGNPKSDDEEESSNEQVELIINKLLDNYTDNDLKVINETISILKKQKYDLAQEVIRIFIQKISLTSKTIIGVNLEHLRLLTVDEVRNFCKKTLKAEQFDKFDSQKTYEISTMYDYISDYETSIMFGKSALKKAELERLSIDLIAMLHSHLGSIYVNNENYRKGIIELIRSAKIYKKIYISNIFKLDSIYNDIGLSLTRMHKLKLAKIFLEQSAEYCLKKNGIYSASYATSLNNLGLIELNQNNFENAIINFTRSLDIFKS